MIADTSVPRAPRLRRLVASSLNSSSLGLGNMAEPPIVRKVLRLAPSSRFAFVCHATQMLTRFIPKLTACSPHSRPLRDDFINSRVSIPRFATGSRSYLFRSLYTFPRNLTSPLGEFRKSRNDAYSQIVSVAATIAEGYTRQ
jgi:hypothetical protein